MSAIATSMGRPHTRPRKSVFKSPVVRAVISIVTFIVLWEIGSRLKLPWVGDVPPPSVVMKALVPLLNDPGYWYSWYQSSRRVLTGFLAAMIIDIPFPVFEILRPVPPLAWVPAAIIFWPTQELSIGFVIFLGAIFTIMLNVI